MKKLQKYLKVWWLMSRNSFLSVFYAKLSLTIFLFGKIIRFVLFVAFLFFILKGTKTLAGFSLNQVVFFFLTFNLIDVLAQFFYRDVYRFRPMIVSGSFDLVLIKPMNSLFRSLMSGADVIDLITIPPLVAAIFIIGRSMSPTLFEVVLYLALVVNGFLIATAFHIFILGLAIITLEIDHTIMIYRDVLNLGRLPIDIYKQPLQGILTYLIPVGLMVTLPAKALMGLVSPGGILIAFGLGIFTIFISVKFWNFALTKYTSASS